MLRSIRQRVTVVSNVLLLGAVLVAWYYVLVAGKVLSGIAYSIIIVSFYVNMYLHTVIDQSIVVYGLQQKKSKYHSVRK